MCLFSTFLLALSLNLNRPYFMLSENKFLYVVQREDAGTLHRLHLFPLKIWTQCEPGYVWSGRSNHILIKMHLHFAFTYIFPHLDCILTPHVNWVCESWSKEVISLAWHRHWMYGETAIAKLVLKFRNIHPSTCCILFVWAVHTQKCMLGLVLGEQQVRMTRLQEVAAPGSPWNLKNVFFLIPVCVQIKPTRYNMLMSELRRWW